MFPVSDEYRTQIDRVVRNPSYVRLSFGITNTDAQGMSSILTNSETEYSNTQTVDKGFSVYTPIATLEQNRWKLNGQFHIYDIDNPSYQGYVSNDLSGEDGMWEESPFLHISFSDYVQFSGLSFKFDSGGQNWHPIEFKVTAYHDADIVYDSVANPDSDYFVIFDRIPICNKLELVWLKNNTPYSRARLGTLIYGIQSELTDSDLISVVCSREVDPISTSFPKSDLSFTIFDANGQYDPDNPSGLWEYLESRQPVSAEIGYELDGGRIEWMPWANCYTTGDVSSSGQGVSLQITIQAASIVNHLTMQYDEGMYYPGGRSLFDLANDLMTFAGFDGAITLDESLKNIVTTQPLPVDAVNNLLQLIANAGRCVLDVGRGGEVSILPQKEKIEDFGYDFSKLKTVPTITKVPPLKNLEVLYNTVSVEETVSVVVDKAEIANANNTEVTLSHDAITNGQVTVSGLTLHSYKVYAYKTVVVVSGTGTVTVKGNKLISNEMPLVKRYGEVGEDLNGLKNTLLTSFEMASAYADWIAAYEARRNTYSATDRGYPEIDVGDNVGFVSGSQNQINVTQIAQTITYTGYISGEGKWLIYTHEE